MNTIHQGGIRGNQIYPIGDLSKGDLVHMHPFGNTVVTISMNGAELLSYIRSTLTAYADTSGSFLQISGFKVVYRKVGNGAQFVSASFNDGTVITDSTPAMKVGTNNYVYSQAALKDLPLDGMVKKSDGLPLLTALERYIAAQPGQTVGPAIGGRITWA